MIKKQLARIGLLVLTCGCARGEEARVYVDADDGRRHAVIEADLEGEAGGERLIVRIRSFGAGVEAEGGWRARDGFNAHTAREMESVLRADGFEARLQGPEGVGRKSEVAWEKRFGTFPRRSLREDGTIDYLARTGSLVSELTLQTMEGLAGTDRFELLARGEARLALDYDVASGRITGVHMPGHSRTVPVALLVAESAPVEPLVLPEDWAQRAREGKWRWYELAVRDDVEERGRMVEALRLAKDWLFLEEVALYTPGAFSTHQIGVILHEAGAPNWRRLVGWFGRVGQGHSSLQTTSLLAAELEKPRSLGWFHKHADRLDENLKTLQLSFEQAGVAAVEPNGDLPPWTEEEVFGAIGLALEADGAERSADTIAKVARGIDGWAVSERWGSPWGEKVVDLIDDAEWRIAAAACLAFSHGNATAVPMERLWQVAEDGKKDLRVREAAFLGWSYGSWGEVFKVAHEILESPEHPLWKPAVSRLGELGTGWTEQVFEELAARDGKTAGREGRIVGERRRLLIQERELLGQRLAGGNNLAADFDATAWSTVLGYRRSADMEEWMLRKYGAIEFNTDASREAVAAGRGWQGEAVLPKVLEEREATGRRLRDELEFRWAKAGPPQKGVE